MERYEFIYFSPAMDYTPIAPLQRGKTLHPNACPRYETKESDGEAPVMLEFCGMWCTPLLSSLPGPHWFRVVAFDGVLSMDQIELKYVLMLNWIICNRTVYMYKNGFGIK